MKPFDPASFVTLPTETLVRDWTGVRDIGYLADDVEPGRRARCRLHVFHPKAQSGTPVLVFVHGGGLTGGSPDELPEIYKHLGCVIVTPTYRLYPDASYPDFIEDIAEALNWTYLHVAEFGGDPGRIFVAGHSAGAYLVACLALMPAFLVRHNRSPRDFAGFIPISGSMVTHFAVQMERTGSNAAICVDEAAPIHHAAKDTPPLLFLCGDSRMDIPGRAADNKLMGDALAARGNTVFKQYEIPGTDHGSVMDAAYAYLLTFIRERLADARQ